MALLAGPTLMLWMGYSVKESSKNVILWVELRVLGVVGVGGASSYGVLLPSACILWVEWAWLDYMCLYYKFYDNKFSRDIFSYGTWIFVYVLIHVMYLCVYVNMICQQCMLYDDMYLQDNYKKPSQTSISSIYLQEELLCQWKLAF